MPPDFLNAQAMVDDAMDDQWEPTVEATTDRKPNYGDLHDQLTAIISGTTLLRHGAMDVDESALRAELAAAMDVDDEEQVSLLEGQLRALETLIALNEGEGRRAAERVLDKKKIDEKQARELLRWLQGNTRASEALGERISHDLKAVLDDYTAKIGDKRLGAEFRGQLLVEIGDFLKDDKILQSEREVGRMRQMLDDGVKLSSRLQTREITKELESISVKMATADSIHTVSERLKESNLESEESQAELKELVTLVGELDGFAEEQTRLAELTKDDIEHNEESLRGLRQVLWRLADRTVETKTLHSLDQINMKFDRSLINDRELQAAVQKNALGQELIDNPDKVSTGGGAFLPALAALFGSPQLAPAAALLSGPAEALGATALTALAGTKMYKWIKGKKDAAKKGVKAAPGKFWQGTKNLARNPKMAVDAAKQVPGKVANIGKTVANVAKTGVAGGAGMLGGLGRSMGNFLPSMGKALPAARSVPLLGTALGGALTAYDYSQAESGQERAEAIGGGLGGIGGAAGGAMLGAAMGSVVPVVGTAIGAIAGGLIGGFAGDALGDWAAGSLFDDAEDLIPDDLKEKTAVEKADAIKAALSEGQWTDGDAINEDDKVKLMEYANALTTGEVKVAVKLPEKPEETAMATVEPAPAMATAPVTEMPAMRKEADLVNLPERIAARQAPSQPAAQDDQMRRRQPSFAADAISQRQTQGTPNLLADDTGIQLVSTMLFA